MTNEFKGLLHDVRGALKLASSECFEDSEYYAEFQEALTKLDAFLEAVEEIENLGAKINYCEQNNIAHKNLCIFGALDAAKLLQTITEKEE